MKESKDNSSENKNRMKEATADWLKNIDPGKVMNSAQQILNTAVNVLEEEIAAGILAAKKLEKKVIDVDEIRSNPEELMSRIRRDTHEAVDIFLDAVTTLTNHISNLSGSVKSEKSAPESDIKPPFTTNDSTISIIQNDGFAKIGDIVMLTIALNNDSKEAIKIVFQKPDLTGPKNQKILARNMSIHPSNLILEPDSNKEALLKIKIPKNCHAGTYSGLLCDTTNEHVRTVVNINVA
jgi:hypothetical protein